MVRVVILGNYSGGNLGDQLILEGLKLTLLDEVPEVQLNIPSKKLLSRMGATLKADVIIFGGGGLLAYYHDWKLPLYHVLPLIPPKLFRRKSALMYGVGCYGNGRAHVRLSWQFLKPVLRWLFSTSQLVAVRDETSKEELEPVLNRHVEVFSDASFALSLPRAQGDYVAINLCPPLSGTSYNFVDIASAFDKLIKDGAKLKFIAMTTPKCRADDYLAYLELQKKMRHVIPFLRARSTNELKTFFSDLKLAIGMRFHFLILSTLSEVPVISFEYSPKIRAFMKAVGVERYLLPLDADSSTIYWTMRKILEEKEELVPSLIARIAHHRAIGMEGLEELVQKFGIICKKSERL